MCFYHPWPFFQIHGTARAFKRNIRHGLDMNQKQSIEIPTQKLRKKNVFCLQAATDLEDTGNKNHNDKTFSLRKRKCNQVQQKLRDKEKQKATRMHSCPEAELFIAHYHTRKIRNAPLVRLHNSYRSHCMFQHHGAAIYCVKSHFQSSSTFIIQISTKL